MAAEGGVLTFTTALDNDQLEKDLQDAQSKVEELKKKVEDTEGKKSAIEQQMESAEVAIRETEAKIRELEAELQRLESADPMNMDAWHSAQSQIPIVKQQIEECKTSIEEQITAQDRLNDKWQSLDGSVSQYRTELESATTTANDLAQRVSSAYYQAGVGVRQTFASMSSSVSQFANRIGRLIEQTFVFSVFTQALRSLKSGIADALQQNQRFSATWEYLSATMQGFANGVANAIAPALITVVNAVTSCIVTLAKAIDAVFKTGLVAAIGAARKASEESWRQTDASKDAARQAEANAKVKAKQDERYQKQVESYRKKQEASAKRLADAQETAADRRAKAEQKYPDALEDAAERQAKAEEKMQKRLAEAEETAAERQAKAQERAAKRLAQAEETAAERNAAAQEAYEKRVAKAEERAAKQAASAEKRRTKEAERLEKAQKRANQTLLGFDEINKLNAESTDEATEAMDDYTDYMESVDPAKVYEVDPSDYVIDPDDYAIDYDDYKIDPMDFFVDPEDFQFDPMDYWVDPEDYALDPFSFDFEDFPEVDVESTMKPTWDALDTGKVTTEVAALETALAGMLLAVGAILAFSGINIPVGLACMAAGALLYAKVAAEDWEKLPAELRDKITGALTLTGIALLVIGAVLAFSMANIPVGVGMMVAGAALLGYTSALNWGGLTPQMQSVLTTLMGVVAGFLFAMGVVLCLAGQMPFGIGLIIAGFAVVAEMVALNWDSLQGTLQQKLAVIGEIVGGVLFGIGVMVCLMGHPAIGIGLMVAGIAAIGVTQAIVNWDTIGPLLEQHVNEILAAAMIGLFAIGVLLVLTGHMPLGIGCIVGATIAGVTLAAINWDTLGPLLEQHVNAILAVAMIGLFAMGVILCLLNNLPLGIGCIVAATIAGVTLAVINWDTLGPLLEQHVNAILAIAMIGLFAVGVILCLLNNLPLGIGCIAASAIAGVTLAVINWDTIGPLLEQHVNEILGIAMVGLFAIGVILCLLNMLPLGVGCIVAATIAGVTLAVINWDTLRPILEEHLNTILGVTMGFLFVIGVVLCMIGNFPLGIGCIVAAAIEGVTLAVINWDFILEKVKEIWGKIVAWWNENVAQIFTVEFWFDLFKSIFNGLIGVLNNMGTAISGWLDDLSYNLGEIVGASGGTYNPPSVRVSNIPPLAKGAVIPPNRKFMALLGDQTHGNNLEAPEGLIRQIVREEAGSVIADALVSLQAQGQANTAQAGGDFVVPLIIDSEELARAVFRGQGRLSRRGMASLELDFT